MLTKAFSRTRCCLKPVTNFQTLDTFTPLPSAYYALLEGQENFVLLETSRFDSANHRSFFFLRPTTIISISRPDDVPRLFAEIEKSLNDGFFVAGYFGYECGCHFENIGANVPLHPTMPLAWLGVYRAPLVFDHNAGIFEGEQPIIPASGQNQYSLNKCLLNVSEPNYRDALDKIKNYISAGDTYQVNFTDKYTFDFEGSPIACFSALREKQKVAYSAFINAGGKHVLSFSPEIFFRIDSGTITTKPMKGTVRRGKYPAEDEALCQWLRHDEKNLSENLMIVDLLRNDVGRAAKTGSVEVKEMFAVEKYETLFQMTSTVQGTLRPGLSLYELFQCLFPSGSVTGAPKRRTMQIIRELEEKPRGVYTGAIGYITPARDAMFSVAIRTLVIDGAEGEMGIGSGIVFDSDAREEYEECALKAEFLTQPVENFKLVESLLWEGSYPLLSFHIDRLRESAAYFGFTVDTDTVLRDLRLNQEQLSKASVYKVRLLLEPTGSILIENQFLSNTAMSGKIVLSSVSTSSHDKFLFHKTTHRHLYESEHEKALQQGFDDVIFCNERGEVTEGAISNVFVEQEGKLHTPPITCGLLPGVYRRHFLEKTPAASEKILSVRDLQTADSIFICNAVRGMRKVKFIG